MSIFFKNEFLKMLQGDLMMSLVKKYSINLTSESEISLGVSSLFGGPNRRRMTHITQRAGGQRRQHFAHEIGFEQDLKLVLVT